jgi:hypothetical protein
MVALALVGKTKRQKGRLRLLDSFRQKVYLNTVIVPNMWKDCRDGCTGSDRKTCRENKHGRLRIFLRKVAEIVVLAKEENKERINKVV